MLPSFSKHGIGGNAILFFTSDGPGPFGRLAEPLRRGAAVQFGDGFGTSDCGCQHEGGGAKGLVLTHLCVGKKTIFYRKRTQGD